METVKNIAAIVGCVLSIISLITIFTKAGRAAIKSFFKQNTKDIEDENARQADDIKEIRTAVDAMSTQLNALSAILKQQCRDTIKNIYYKYCKEKRIPLYERKTVDATFKLYREIWDGNSYVILMHNEIEKWEIDSTSSIFVDEDDKA